MANFFSVLFVIATVVFGLHTVTCQVITAAAMCPCLVPISAPAAAAGMFIKKDYKHISLPNGKSSFEVSGFAYAPDPASQALRITEDGLEAAQAARRQNMNAQAQVSQSSRRQNMNAQSQISQRRQNMNAQSQVSQSGRRAAI